MLKAKYALVLLVVGFCFDFVGALFKIMHWPHADALLLAGMACKAVGALGFLAKLLTHPRVRSFLNR